MLSSRLPLLLLATLALAACGRKKVDVEPVDQTPDVQWPPGFTCPFGAEPAGLPPPDGLEIWCEVFLENGQPQKHGPYRAWHGNGQYSAMGQYDRDRRTGTWNEWYANGKPASEKTWVMGVEQGRVVEFYANGEKKCDGEMVDGLEDGPWTYWSQDGSNTTTGAWVMGEREGEWFEYGPDGQILTERLYRAGRLVKQRGFE